MRQKSNTMIRRSKYALPMTNRLRTRTHSDHRLQLLKQKPHEHLLLPR
jgi:hypothetical protein